MAAVMTSDYLFNASELMLSFVIQDLIASDLGGPDLETLSASVLHQIFYALAIKKGGTPPGVPAPRVIHFA